MASSSDVVKKVMRFKLQLSDTAESATVVKILQKLKDLDITLDILAETGIGKTVNSLRRHEKAGEFAKLLVRGWKRLVPKESTSHTEDGEASESLSIKDKLDDKLCQNNESLTVEDLNNNCLTSLDKSKYPSDEAVFKKEDRKADSEKQCHEQKTHKHQLQNQEKGQKENESISQREELEKKGEIQEEQKDKSVISTKKKIKNQEKDRQENKSISKNDVSEKRIEFPEDKMDDSAVSKKRKIDQSYRKSGGDDTGNESSEDTHQKSKSYSRERIKSSSESGRFGSEKESNKTSNEPSNKSKDSLSFETVDKYSKRLQLDDVKNEKSSGISMDSDKQNNKRKKGKEKHSTRESENTGLKHKKAKMKHKDKEREEPSMSFESFLNYDVNVSKRKEKSAVKKPPRKIKTVVKEEATKDAGRKSAVMDVNVASPKRKFKESVLDLMNIPLPAVLLDFEKPSCFEYFERKVEKEPDLCDVSEESAGFTGQRLNKKMQVYSGAKTVFLPAMMSLHQQCIRTLQNNINLLYETGGVPFEILEPVLERCTPEQLLRIEECNPIYVGETDHLWGKHCQRDFKHSKLQEYESWKEMYIRLSEERERKLQRLTKSIVSAHSSKPKGRQVKMAFIHTVAKPPRDVRIQQEIHGTAAQQPQPPKCSVKVQENRPRPSCDEPSRSSSSSSGAGNTQDLRKKTRVAPMMAKSLKAFKKQLGRR